jgi:hypothetical protein
MAERPKLDDSIITRKGDARPIVGKRTPITVKLDEELYGKLVAYSGQFVPRKTHQAILVEALEQFLERMG